MKKILAVVLALTMIVGMGITTFAANSLNEINLDPATVTAKYSFTNSSAVVYGVEIEWTDVQLNYEVVKEWDPSALNYLTKDGDWTNTTVSVDITNKSNAAISATLSFTAEGGVDCTMEDVTDTVAAATVGNAGTKTLTGTLVPSGEYTITGDVEVGTLTVALN